MNLNLNITIQPAAPGLTPLVELKADPAPAPASAQQWAATLPCGRVSHADALKQIEILNDNKFQGYADWRLPEVWELASRVDYTRHDPATNDADVKSGFHWSNTAYAPNPADYAWGVLFNSGDVGYGSRGYYGFVRAVRGPVAARPGQ